MRPNPFDVPVMNQTLDMWLSSARYLVSDEAEAYSAFVAEGSR